VSESNQSNKFFNDGQTPVPIPPADQGWEAMRRKLDTMMPVNPSQTPGNVWQAISGKTISIITAVATTATLSTYLLVKNLRQQPTHTTVASNTVSKAAVDAVQADSIYNNGQASFAGDEMNNASGGANKKNALTDDLLSSETAANEIHNTQQQNSQHTGANVVAIPGVPGGTANARTTPSDIKADATTSNTTRNKHLSGNSYSGYTGQHIVQTTGNAIPVNQYSGTKDSHTPNGQMTGHKDAQLAGTNNTGQTGNSIPVNKDETLSIDTIASSSSIGYAFSDAGNMEANNNGLVKGSVSNSEAAPGKDPKVFPSNGTLGGTITDKPTKTTGSRLAPYTGGFSTTDAEARTPASRPVLATGTQTPVLQDGRILPQVETMNKPADNNGHATTAAAGNKMNSSFQPMELSFISTANAMPLEGLHLSNDMNATRLEGNTNLSLTPQPVISSRAYDDITRWRLYVQLNIAAPLYRRDTYIVGPDGKHDVAKNLIPAIRLERKIGRGALSVDGMPFINNTMPKNEFRIHSVIHPDPVYDTLVTVLKQFGWGVSLQYRIPVYKRFSIEAGVQSTFLQTATIRQSNNVFLDSVTVEQRTKLRPARQQELDSLHHVRMGAVLGITYDMGQWQAGVRSVFPLRPAGRKGTTDIKSPVQLEVVLRWRVFAK